MEFEVASVKPQPFAGSSGSVGIFVRGNTLNAEHVSLYDLVLYAYNLRDVQLSGGPAWAQSGVLQFSELFQVIAKVPGDYPPQTDVLRQMMQTLLADRFKLQIHHVQKDLPAYNLVVNKGGPKLKESAAGDEVDSQSVQFGKGWCPGYCQPHNDGAVDRPATGSLHGPAHFR